jgi:AraC-like DNA-binding protein/uncharacterized damage-inducible protein DinB
MDSEKLSAVILNSLDADAGADELARAAHSSRSNFYRLFQAMIEENPGAMRRRLLLERAAWQLSTTQRPVTEIALDAHYGSLEAFSRAFSSAFRVSPSLYRRSGTRLIHLSSPNPYHFRPTTHPLKGNRSNMDLFELFSGGDAWYTRRLLQQAEQLNDEQLDRPVHNPSKVFPWDKPDGSLREILERIVQTKEVWSEALTDGEMPALDNIPAPERAPAALLRRFEKAEAKFQGAIADVRKRGAWEETFVDALCEPAETFTYGGMFAHVITFNTWRRLAALDAFQQLGVHIPGAGCPSEYETAMRG